MNLTSPLKQCFNCEKLKAAYSKRAVQGITEHLCKACHFQIYPDKRRKAFDLVMGEIERLKQVAIAKRTYELPRRAVILKNLNLSTGYFHQKTPASKQAAKAYQQAEAYLIAQKIIADRGTTEREAWLKERESMLTEIYQRDQAIAELEDRLKKADRLIARYQKVMSGLSKLQEAA